MENAFFVIWGFFSGEGKALYKKEKWYVPFLAMVWLAGFPTEQFDQEYHRKNPNKPAVVDDDEIETLILFLQKQCWM